MVGINFRAIIGFTGFHFDFCFSSRNTSLILVEGWHLAGLDDRQTGTQAGRLRIAAASKPGTWRFSSSGLCASLHRDKHESQPNEPQTTDGTSNSSCLPTEAGRKTRFVPAVPSCLASSEECSLISEACNRTKPIIRPKTLESEIRYD
jgi:hypothetical protein